MLCKDNAFAILLMVRASSVWLTALLSCVVIVIFKCHYDDVKQQLF